MLLASNRADRGLECLKLEIMFDLVVVEQGTWLSVPGGDTATRVSAIELPSENPGRLEVESGKIGSIGLCELQVGL